MVKSDWAPAVSGVSGTVLENVENIHYLGVTITNEFKWNTHFHFFYKVKQNSRILEEKFVFLSHRRERSSL